MISNVMNRRILITKQIKNFNWFPSTYDSCQFSSSSSLSSCKDSRMNCETILKNNLEKTIGISIVDDRIYRFIYDKDIIVIVNDFYDQISNKYRHHEHLYLDGGQIIHMKNIQQLMIEHKIYRCYIRLIENGLTLPNIVMYQRIDTKTQKIVYNFDLYFITTRKCYYHLSLETFAGDSCTTMKIETFNVKTISKAFHYNLIKFIKDSYIFLIDNNSNKHGQTFRIIFHPSQSLFEVYSMDQTIDMFFWCFVYERNIGQIIDPFEYQITYGFGLNNNIYLISNSLSKIAIIDALALSKLDHTFSIKFFMFKDFFLCQWQEIIMTQIEWIIGTSDNVQQSKKKQIECRTFIKQTFKQTIGISLINNNLYISTSKNVNQIIIFENVIENDDDSIILGKYGYLSKITNTGFGNVWKQMSCTKNLYYENPDHDTNDDNYVHPFSLSMLNTTLKCSSESKQFYSGLLYGEIFGYSIQLYWQTTIKTQPCTIIEIHYTNMDNNNPDQQQNNYHFIEITGQNEFYKLIMLEENEQQVYVWRRKPDHKYVDYIGQLCWSSNDRIRIVYNYKHDECQNTIELSMKISYGFIGKINKLYLVSLSNNEILIIDGDLLQNVIYDKWYSIRTKSIEQFFQCQPSGKPSETVTTSRSQRERTTPRSQREKTTSRRQREKTTHKEDTITSNPSFTITTEDHELTHDSKHQEKGKSSLFWILLAFILLIIGFLCFTMLPSKHHRKHHHHNHHHVHKHKRGPNDKKHYPIKIIPNNNPKRKQNRNRRQERYRKLNFVSLERRG
ncbi:hypothetical protein DERP_012311 [Dermatophagoides pteronyssinus]|uniref:Uncharacterized protein n=2 Tax=Dermatophagoides pteronyssinus TaxID=6956 RepID=A0ABQ8JR42_DERPT|nr:hypothetical protein DERP_012311 [Dermatophagoides pteronyssinus]